jgi:ABC-type amino acid transport substrate-binding protein
MKKREFLTTLGNIILAAPVGYVAGKVSKGDSENNGAQKPSMMERIKKDGTIKIGYFLYAPALSRNVNSKQFSGIFYDVLERIGSSTNIKIDWSEEVTLGSMYEGFKTGRYDAIGSTVWVNGPRSLQGDFSVPLYYSGVSAYVRADDTRFDGADLDVLNSANVTISTIDGEMAAIIAAETFPEAKTQSMAHSTPLIETLISVSTGKADVSFVEDDFANKFLAQHPGSIKKLSTVMAVPNTIAIPSGDIELKNFIDTNIELMQANGFLEQTLAKHEDVPGTLLRPAKPYADG